MVSPFPRTASARRGTGGRWWMRPPRGATARCSVRATLARHPKFCVQRRLHLTQRAPQLGLVALVEQLGSHQLVVAVLGTVERRGRHAAAAERWRDGRSPWGRWRTRRKNTRGPRLQVLHMYKAHSDSYVCSLVPGTATFQQSQFTPGGSNMQYVTTATFLLLAYAKYLRTGGAAVSCAGCDVHPAELVALAKRQVDYILGKNPRGVSYMVGFGPRFPRRLHHRGASMPALRDHPGRIGCDEGFRYLHSGEDDRYVLVGAVVGGPDARDAFADDRDSYGQSEPATYVNAPLVRALAFFAGN